MSVLGFWADIRVAMQQAIVAASGFNPDRVIWADQNANMPPDDFIDLSLSGFVNPGQDGILSTYDAAAPAGREITQQVIGQREVTLTVEVFTTTLVSSHARNAVLTGDDALAVVDRIRSMFMFDTIRDPAAALGISFFDLSANAEYVPKIVSAGFRGRCVWPVRCWVPAMPVTQQTTYIQKVEGTVRATGAEPPPIVLPFDTSNGA